MVVDTSALIAILFREPGWEGLEDAILRQPPCWISAIGRLEAAMVVEGRKGSMHGDLDELIQNLELRTIPFDETQLAFAVDAFRRYGKGRHKAALNLGDCCAYGLAKALDEPLLFKGDDFSQTGVASVPTG
jgi:ribonuclease VapC